MRDNRLLFGPIAAGIMLLGIAGLALAVPGYDSVRQTVSEIGEMGSPARIPFAIMLWAVAACLLVFAVGVRKASLDAGCSAWGAWFIAFMAVPAAGIGIFAFPHPLHNMFGMSELIGYQAPLAFALSWRRSRAAKPQVVFSWTMFGLVWVAIILNLTTLDRHGAIWEQMRPIYGLVQRALFAVWFVWCGVIGSMMWRSRR
jgi:hypothetical membrane protein